MCAGIAAMAEMLDLCFSSASLSMATVESLLDFWKKLKMDVDRKVSDDAFKSMFGPLVKAKPDGKLIRQLLQSTVHFMDASDCNNWPVAYRCFLIP